MGPTMGPGMRRGLLLAAVGVLVLPALGSICQAQGVSDELNVCIMGLGFEAPAKVVDSCTAAIDTGRLSETNRISALNNRGIAYKDEGDFAHAIQDFSEVLKIDPNYNEAINNRGALYMVQGDYDDAIVDYTKAIELKPDYAMYVRNRGSAYISKGDYTNAMQDYNHALMLEPQSAIALQMRGILHYFMGDYKSALDDEKSSVNFNEMDQYSVIWLYLARARFGKNAAGDALDELGYNSANLSLTNWPGQVIQVYLGKAKAEDLFSAGLSNARFRSDRVCEINFYLGERALLTGNADEAKRDFQAALSSGSDMSNLEYRGAQVEMSRMAAQK